MLNKTGLRYQGKLTRWKEIEDGREKDGELTIKVTGREWQSHTLVEAPLVVELVKHVMRARLVKILAARADVAENSEMYRDISTEQQVE